MTHLYRALILAAVMLIGVGTIIPIGSAHSLGFSIYENNTLLPLYKTYYANATGKDILIDDVYSNPERGYIEYYNQPQVFPRLIFTDNYTELTSQGFQLWDNNVALAKAFNFTGNDYITLDLEDWSSAPQTEQQNYAQYTQMACQYVHNAGYKFGFAPEIDIPGWGQFSQVNWSCIDFLDLQEQFLSNNTSALINNVTSMINSSKAQNPNLTVFVQLGMGAGQATMESDIKALSYVKGVDGVIIQDLSTSQQSNNTLTTLVDYAQSFDNTALVLPNTTTTTSSTTSTTVSTSTSLPQIVSPPTINIVPQVAQQTTIPAIDWAYVIPGFPLIVNGTNSTTTIQTTTTILTNSTTHLVHQQMHFKLYWMYNLMHYFSHYRGKN